MLRYLGIITFVFVFVQGVFSQEVSGSHDIKFGGEPNEYTIKTTIKGLQGVDIARIKYIIDNKHTYKPSPNNALFSDRNEQYIKFYIMAIPASGELNIELGIVLLDGEEYAFPVEFQFSKNEEKQTIYLPQINLSSGEAIAIVDVSVPVTPVVEEAEIVEEAPAVEKVSQPIVEEDPEIIEAPEPVVPEVEEEPAVEVVPEPVVEEIPTVEEVPEPVVEEGPEIIEVPDPVDPVIEPVHEEVLEVEETSASAELSKTIVRYTIQLLSLSEFSQSKLKVYCRQHNLSIDDVKKNQVGNWMKITYGEASSIEEANQIKERLIREHNIDGAFITKVK
ncbi:MAG: hypothetical protein JKX68_12320 [Flavobacteriales bacterium]|nr:hypothetical protein [Flavobacteriales bacterium]